MSSAPETATAVAPGAVIVTYFPDAGFESRLAAIARQIESLVVVDNSADDAVAAHLRSLCAVHGAQLIVHSTNLGLAAALNAGFRLLAERRLLWAVAFDQDSTPQPEFAAELLATAHRGDGPPPAVVGANWHDEARPGHVSRHLRPHPWIPGAFARVAAVADVPEVTCVITSGSLFHLPTWRTLGGFDEALFLDLVDHDYCLRARAAGHAIAVAARARLAHRRGAKRPIRRLGRTWWPAFMPPSRLRGLFRNRVLLFRRHAWRAPHWAAFEFVFAARILADIVLLEEGKAAKLAACVRGTWDGLRGRTGPVA